ncbi:MAG TPA: hypothetical protein VI248_00590 [Kineosporiaceae bacterium]
METRQIRRNDHLIPRAAAAVPAEGVTTGSPEDGIRPEFSRWLRARLVAEAAARIAARTDRTLEAS